MDNRTDKELYDILDFAELIEVVRVRNANLLKYRCKTGEIFGIEDIYYPSSPDKFKISLGYLKSLKESDIPSLYQYTD